MNLLPHLVNPNLSLPLFLLGLFLLYLDFNIPGKVVPAALGTLALCLAMWGLIHTPIQPFAFHLTIFCLLCILVGLTNNVLATLGTIGLCYALFHLADVPNAPHRVHPAIALVTATAFTVVTLKLGRIALLARRNKAIQPKPAPAR